MTVPAEEPTTTTAEQDSDLITIEGLIKHFPIRAGILRRQVAAVQAVDGIDFTVKRRETFSIVGESGCGNGRGGCFLFRCPADRYDKQCYSDKRYRTKDRTAPERN